MVKERFPIRDIQGYSPAIELRNAQDVFSINGKNFYFDSRGPKSGFGSRLVAGLNIIEVPDGVVQSITIGRQAFVISSQHIYILNEAGTTWISVYNLAGLFGTRVDPWRKKWTAAYLSKGVYLCHPDFGLLKWNGSTFNKLSQETTAGLPKNPLAIAETNGRLCILSRHFITWSAPSNAEYLIPELGGAGQQRLSDRIPGSPVTVVGFQQGFLVWTDEGCLTAEYIGGDTVFRFDRMTTDQLPVSSYAITELPDGSYLLCTKQGIHRTDNGREPEAITPIFNEFFRNVLKHESFIQVRLDYQMETDLLYIQLRDWTNHYVRTYVLSAALDKWGLFSERHYGMIRYAKGRGSFGYVDNKGVVHKFVTHAYDREVVPGEYVGLDSEIEFGYIRPPNLLPEIDTLLEMHEIFLGGIPSVPEDVDITIYDQPVIPAPVYNCESLTDPIATTDLKFTNFLTLAQRQNDYDSSNGVLIPEDYIWDNYGIPLMDLDSGDIWKVVWHVGDWSEPGYYTDKHILGRIDGVTHTLGDQYTNTGTLDMSSYYVNALSDMAGAGFDRHTGDYWAMYSGYVESGFPTTLTRHEKAQGYNITAKLFGKEQPIQPDVALGGSAVIIGFTDDSVIVVHEPHRNKDFKVEVYDKVTLASKGSAYIHNPMPGSGFPSQGVDPGAFWGNDKWCMGPDDCAYYVATRNYLLSPPLHANGTYVSLYRFNTNTFAYENITPWSNLNLPVNHPAATVNTILARSIFYCRATNRIIIHFVLKNDAALPFPQWGGSGFHFLGAWDLETETWENLGRMDQTLYFNNAGENVDTAADANWYVNGVSQINMFEWNMDGLPMPSPCGNYLRTVENIYKVEGGVAPVLADFDNPAKCGIRVTVRDPLQNYKVIHSFNEIADTRYAAHAAAAGVPQFLRFLVGEPFLLQLWSDINLKYRPTDRSYVAHMWGYLSSTQKDFIHNIIGPETRDLNFANTEAYMKFKL